ncbi:MAG TPA: DUF2442 domain-containing protein [Draconibacterium sp.]|nr:DUF2442 domain-containing protein [Draconibacterium sp.]
MKSEIAGKNTLEVEVTNISMHGFWLLLGEKEFFLPFNDFPWFKDARISEISDVTLLNDQHLFWEKLDIDLTLNMIQNPQKYPLISK